MSRFVSERYYFGFLNGKPMRGWGKEERLSPAQLQEPPNHIRHNLVLLVQDQSLAWFLGPSSQLL